MLGGFEIRTDAEVVRYPDRYDPGKRGQQMWAQMVEFRENGLELGR